MTSLQRLPEVLGRAGREVILVGVQAWTASVYLCAHAIAHEFPFGAVRVVPFVALLTEQQPFGAGASRVALFAESAVSVTFSHHTLAVAEFERQVL